ncbi:MAG: hypothetical protein KA260_04720 [Burkholderiales bacterium]|nr:hypothetical protein [Burkholderiales bacterium]
MPSRRAKGTPAARGAPAYPRDEKPTGRPTCAARESASKSSKAQTAKNLSVVDLDALNRRQED